MKNNFLLLIICFFIGTLSANSADLNIDSDNIKITKDTQIVLFNNNVKATDSKNNIFFADFAKFNKSLELLESIGKAKIITSENFEVNGNNIFFDNLKKVIYSNEKTKIIDTDGNEIFVDMFNYSIDTGMFFSRGKILVKDIKDNEYNFSEIYINEKQNKIIGSDVKVFFKDENWKINKDNDPRFFANSVIIANGKSTFDKGIFSFCKIREGGKCPPWSLQSKKIEHDPSKKTIFYDNAVLKVYDFPIFYYPKFSHPDPTVKRRSGFLVPTFGVNSDVGSGITTPYYLAISKDKDFTFTPKFYVNENPLFLSEYRQEFKRSNLIIDNGYTQGYKNTTNKKTAGTKGHFFSKYEIDFDSSENNNSNLKINLQRVSNDTYLKVHDINTELVSDDIEIISNNLEYEYQDNDIFFNANVSAFENLTIEDNSKYEYLFPYLTLEKNLITDSDLGVFDLSSKFRVRNYDVSKQTEFVVNDINWKSNKWVNNQGFENELKSKIKLVNYNASDATAFKTEGYQSEISGAFGFLSKLGLYKIDNQGKFQNTLTPKMLLRYAPGHMRNLTSGSRLKYDNLFEINKIEEIDVIENGLSSAIGLDYAKHKVNKDGSLGGKKLSFSIGQQINASENDDMPNVTSLNQRFSDVVGGTDYNVTEALKLNYNFSIDQNYSDINYNEIGAKYNIEKVKFNINYLEESNHIGSKEYITSDITYNMNNKNQLSFSTKRNMLTNSADFYNLSYDYINDCLKAGIVFRREFYTDRDVEPENNLIFRISIIPFGGIDSPPLN